MKDTIATAQAMLDLMDQLNLDVWEMLDLFTGAAILGRDEAQERGRPGWATDRR